MKTRILNIKTLLMTSLIGACVSFGQENYSTWAHFRDISVNGGATGAHTSTIINQFPLLVRLTPADTDVFAQAAAKGADIRFSKADGVTRLPYQRERWDAVNKVAEFWVQMDTVKANAYTRLRIYWGKNGAADSSNGGEVFDSVNGFVGVWHLGDSTLNNARPDAVAGGPKAVLQNFDSTNTYPVLPYVPVPGVIGLADSLAGGTESAFQGSKPYIDVGRTSYAGFSDFTGGFSYSVWAWDNGPETYERYLEALDDTGAANSSANRIILFGNYASDPNDLAVRWGSGTSFNGTTVDIVTGVWQQMFFTKAPNAGTLTVYCNGVATDSATGLADLPVATRNYVYMGRSTVTAGDPYYNGKFDEMEMSKVSRSADWVNLSYSTQSPTQTVVALGPTGDTALPVVGINNRVSSVQGFSIVPSAGGFMFSLPANLSGARISVMDIWGRMVWSQTVASGSSQVFWNTRTASHTAAPGIYLVRLTGSGLHSQVLADSKITLVP